MNKYQVVIDEIVNKDNISEKDFIINKMVENMVFLLNEVDLFIENNKTTLIFPLLRQVYEYCLLSLALQESIISLSDFLDPVYSDGSRKKDLIGNVTGKIYDYVLKNSNKDTANVFKSILKSLKQQLNDHTHAGFDRLLRFMMESNNKEGASDFIKEDARFIEWHVKLLFITFVNEKYNLKIELDNFSYAEYLKRNTKESLSLILPDDYERLMESSDVKRYISYKTKDVKVISEHIDEFKTIISNLSDEKEYKVVVNVTSDENISLYVIEAMLDAIRKNLEGDIDVVYGHSINSEVSNILVDLFVYNKFIRRILVDDSGIIFELITYKDIKYVNYVVEFTPF